MGNIRSSFHGPVTQRVNADRDSGKPDYHLAWSPPESGLPMRLKESSYPSCMDRGGHGPFRGLDAPFALVEIIGLPDTIAKPARDGFALV
ncbi:MAG TPA: hypothetical protein VFH01_13140 [Pyrinomonadaceae bacterium]|nr:hypothetical protein [Pyrinomonadaceae bacterium]